MRRKTKIKAIVAMTVIMTLLCVSVVYGAAPKSINEILDILKPNDGILYSFAVKNSPDNPAYKRAFVIIDSQKSQEELMDFYTDLLKQLGTVPAFTKIESNDWLNGVWASTGQYDKDKHYRIHLFPASNDPVKMVHAIEMELDFEADPTIPGPANALIKAMTPEDGSVDNYVIYPLEHGNWMVAEFWSEQSKEELIKFYTDFCAQLNAEETSIQDNGDTWEYEGALDDLYDGLYDSDELWIQIRTEGKLPTVKISIVYDAKILAMVDPQPATPDPKPTPEANPTSDSDPLAPVSGI